MPTATELGRQLEKKRRELAGFLSTRTRNGGFDFGGDDLKAFNDRNEEIARLHDAWVKSRDMEEAAQENETALKALQTVNRAGLFSATSYSGAGGFSHTGGRSLGEQFVESAEYKACKGQGESARFVVDIPGLSLKTVFSTSAGIAPYPPQQPGVVPFATRRPVVADLLPQTDSGVPSIIYLEQTTQTFAADTVAEGASKPESAFATTRRIVPLEVIAHTLPITNQTLEDVPGIRDILDQQMTLGVQLAEEDQILNGSGVSPDLQGFLTKSGVQTHALGSDDQFTAIRAAMTLIQFTGYANVTGGVMNPNDWQKIVTLKDSTGRFIYGDPAAQTQNSRLWGVPFVITPAIVEGTALLGDFVMYSRLWRKGGIRVLVGYVNDDLKKNQQTLVVEERVALQISRPAAFCTVTGLETA